jgi:hypothetical protein
MEFFEEHSKEAFSQDAIYACVDIKSAFKMQGLFIYIRKFLKERGE